MTFLPELAAALVEVKDIFVTEEKPLVFSFSTDVFQPAAVPELTRGCIDLFLRHAVPVIVFTKAANRLAYEALEMMTGTSNYWAVSLATTSEAMAAHFEPGSPAPIHRLRMLRDAKAAGLKTILSLNPVTDFDEGLCTIEAAAPFTDFFSVGPLCQKGPDGQSIPETATEFSFESFQKAASDLFARLNVTQFDFLKPEYVFRYLGFIGPIRVSCSPHQVPEVIVKGLKVRGRCAGAAGGAG